MVAERLRTPRIGHDKPRLAPPVPVKSGWKELRDTAKGMGIAFMPWQETASRYLTAIGPDGRRLYREVAVVVARQNGKTTLMKPFIIQGLRAGKRILHLAQSRELPRNMFGLIADALSTEEDLFPKRRGRTIWPRYGSGQEEIALVNGGWYRIAAATQGGGRGWSADMVIIDELREMDNHEVVGMVDPTLLMSEDPQIIELSNAGHEGSLVLNAVRERAGKDATLAYLEWSAAPGRDPADPEGWAEANPALGHFPQVLRGLEDAYRKHSLGGTMSTFETEHLCRWVLTMRERLVHEQVWADCEGDVGKPIRPVMGVSMDPDGKRASAAIAWAVGDSAIHLQMLIEGTGNPIDPAAFGKELRDRAMRLGITRIAFDPITDAELAKFVKKPEPITGRLYQNASARFVQVVEGHELRWADAAAVTEDLPYTARKAHTDTATFEAVRADDDRPITAVLAAIRAVWLASGPRLKVPKAF
jgi:hypothetical protein